MNEAKENGELNRFKEGSAGGKDDLSALNAPLESPAEEPDAETLGIMQDFVGMADAFDVEDPESVRKAAEGGNFAAMFYHGKRLAGGEKPPLAEASEWLRKASASKNPIASALGRMYLGITTFMQGEKQKGRETLAEAVADPVLNRPAVKAVFGDYLNGGRSLLATMLYNGEGGPRDVEGALRLAQATIADGGEDEQTKKIVAEASDTLRHHAKRQKRERVREAARVRGGHAGIMLLRLAEIAVMIVFVPLARKIFNLGGGSADLFVAVHYAVLGFLILGIPGLIFVLVERGDMSDILGWLFWGAAIAAACAYGAYRLERWSVVRAHYQTYTGVLTVLGACLIVYFLCKAVRHFVGIFTGK